MYELTYIINPHLSEEQAAEPKEKIREIIGKQGEIKNEKKEIKRKFAYPIKKFNYGYYAIVDFELPPAELKSLEKYLKSELTILRYLIIEKPKEADSALTTAPIIKKERKSNGKIKIEELDKKLEEILK